MPRRTIWLVLLWTLFVLYPNPTNLAVSIMHASQPVIDPQAVQDLIPTLPEDPHAIEVVVNSTLLPYAVPWQTYGVPWYFPTPREALQRGEGDCQARAVVFASILRAKGIPATLVGSFDHLWVDYPGKQENALENAAVAIAAQQPDGRYTLRWPSLVEWQASWHIERAYFWDTMPRSRLWLLVGGWIVIAQRHRFSLAHVSTTLRGFWKRQPIAMS
jgi:hypothetical protein